MLAMHMFLAGLQVMSVIWNVAKDDAVMVAFSAVMAAFSGFCAFEFYGKILEDPETTP